MGALTIEQQRATVSADNPIPTTMDIENTGTQESLFEKNSSQDHDTLDGQDYAEDEFSEDAMEFEEGNDASSMNTDTAPPDLDDQYKTTYDPDGGKFG